MGVKGVFCERGTALIIVLFLVSILMVLAMAILNISTTEVLMGNYFKDYTAAYYMAEGGLQKTLSMLKEYPDYTSPRWKKYLGKNHPLGGGSFRVILSRISANMINIESHGQVNKAKFLIRAKVKVMIEQIEDEGDPNRKEDIVHIKVISWSYYGPN